MARESITVTPLTGALGAEVSGADVSRPLGPLPPAAMREAPPDRLVTYIHGKTLTPCKAFTRRFASFGEVRRNFLLSAGTRSPIVDRPKAGIVKILRTPETTERLVWPGAIVVRSTVDQAGAHATSEVEKWGGAVRAVGVELD